MRLFGRESLGNGTDLAGKAKLLETLLASRVILLPFSFFSFPQCTTSIIPALCETKSAGKSVNPRRTRRTAPPGFFSKITRAPLSTFVNTPNDPPPSPPFWGHLLHFGNEAGCMTLVCHRRSNWYIRLEPLPCELCTTERGMLQRDVEKPAVNSAEAPDCFEGCSLECS